MGDFNFFSKDPVPVPIRNDSIDVAVKGCFTGYDTVACVRRSVLSALMIVTFTLCGLKVGKFHSVHHEQVHHYVIFYMALVECIICVVNWMLSGHYPQLDMAASALKVLQLVTLCHFHWTQAWRILHKETIAKRVWFPLMAIFSTYIVAVASVGILDVGPSWTECFKPYWIMLSAADFFGVQLFLIAGVYITRKINAISTLECVKKVQKRNLWSVIIAFEASAIVGLAYDLTIRIIGDEMMGCSGVFAHTQVIYSPVFFLFMVFKFCLPIWALLAVLEPLPSGISYSEILATSHSGSLSGACLSHSAASPYRVLGSYVFDDNADVLSGISTPRSRADVSTNSDTSEFSTRHLFTGRIIPTIYIPGHGHVIAPVPRPSSQEWNNPRDYWRSRQRAGNAPQSSRALNLGLITEESNSARSVQTDQMDSNEMNRPDSQSSWAVEVEVHDTEPLVNVRETQQEISS